MKALDEEVNSVTNVNRETSAPPVSNDIDGGEHRRTVILHKDAVDRMIDYDKQKVPVRLRVRSYMCIPEYMSETEARVER